MNKPTVYHPKTKRGEATMNRLLESAEANFLEKGFYNTSIVDIIRGANVALGTFYVYFEDKLSIYQYLLLQYSRQIRRHIAVNIADLETRKEMERVGLKSFLEYIKKYPHTYNIIWESLYIDKSLFVHYYKTFAEFYVRALDKAKDEEQIKDYNNEVVAYVLMGIANFVGLRWTVFDDTDDFDSIVDEVVRLLDEGLFLPKGR